MAWVDVIIRAVVVGMLTAPLFGISWWLSWQARKVGTYLLRGAWTGRYGGVVGFIGQFLALVATVAVSLLAAKLGWFSIVAVVAAMYFGGLLARRIEARLYATERELQAPVKFLRSVPHHDREVAIEMLNNAFPPWWISKMPRRWRMQFRQNILDFLDENCR